MKIMRRLLNWKKIAGIYRRQGNASKGGRFEHEAFLFA